MTYICKLLIYYVMHSICNKNNIFIMHTSYAFSQIQITHLTDRRIVPGNILGSKPRIKVLLTSNASHASIYGTRNLMS